MIPRRFALLIPIAALIGCGAGRSIRVSEGGDAPASEPVALAPTPAAEPATPAAPATSADTASAAAAPSPGRGYAHLRKQSDLWTSGALASGPAPASVNLGGLLSGMPTPGPNSGSELGVGERPSVDFNRDVVVAVAAGQRPTGGYEIAIDRVTQSDGQLTVEVVERTPGPNCMTTASLTQPVDVVVVPAADAKSLSFLERKEIRGCR